VIRVRIRRKPARKNLLLYYHDPTSGKEISRSAKTADMGEAERAARDWENELLAFRGADSNGWDYFRIRFLQSHCVELAKVSTIGYTTALNHYQRLFAPKSVADVTADTLSQFKVKMLETQSLETVFKHIRHIRSALAWAASVGMIRAVPKVKRVRQHKRKWMRGRPITEAEFRKMLKHAHAATGKRDVARWQQLLWLLWYSGMRIEEAIILSWDTPPLYLQLDSKPFPQLVFFVESHKGRRDEATPMPPDLHDWLQAIPRSERRGLVAPVFGERGEPIVRPDTASKAVSRIGRAAKVIVEGERCAAAHDIRRAFGSRWAMLVPPVVLQQMMRHKQIETTLKYYVGLDVSSVGASIWNGRSRKSSRQTGLGGKDRRKPPKQSG
jgi:integrase